MTIGIKFVPYGFFLFLLFVCFSTTYLFLALTVNLFGLLSGSFGFLWAHFGVLCHLFGFLRGWLFRFLGCLYLMFTAFLIGLISLNLNLFFSFLVRLLGLAGLLMAVDFVRNVLSQVS